MVVFKLGHFFAILVFFAYRKAHEPSTDAPTAPIVPINMPDTYTPAGTHPPIHKYIVVNTFYSNFLLLLCVILYRSQKCVAGFLFYPHFAPVGTFKIFNIIILNINPSMFMVLM